jgi:putative hemolysin
VQDFIVLAVLFLLSAFFSGSETALTTVTPARVHLFLSEGRRGAETLNRLKSNTNRMLIAILIGNNLVNIAASAMATVIATERFGHLGPGLAVGVLTLLILVFGEITPKTFAARYAGPISLLVAPPLLVFTAMAFPLVWLLERLTVALQRLSTIRTEPLVTDADLVHMAKHGAREGTIEVDEQRMIERIFAFEDLCARDVMIHRRLVFVLPAAQSIRDALPELLKRAHSRIPLHAGNPDEVEQVVYLRDVLQQVVDGNLDRPLGQVADTPPLFVPLSQPIKELLPSLRRHKERLVVVVDEYGMFQGVLTLEDMLEELVGEIQGETDKPDQQLYEVTAAEVLVDGTAELRIVEELLAVELSGKPTDAVNYWILEHVQRIPTVGERFLIDGVEVVIEKATRRRIQQVRIALAVRNGEPPVEPDDGD